MRTWLNAPEFSEIATHLMSVISECVVGAYNVYFDMRFLDYEMGRARLRAEAPHICLMYLRPMLGLGTRCSLEYACQAHGIAHPSAHVAGQDVQASAQLMGLYLDSMRGRGIRTFRDLGALKRYKFVDSFACDPLPRCGREAVAPGRVKSRTVPVVTREPQRAAPLEPVRVETAPNAAIRTYWDELKTALSDLVITDEEIENLLAKKKTLGLADEQVMALHGRVFASVISRFVDDRWLDARAGGTQTTLHLPEPPRMGARTIARDRGGNAMDFVAIDFETANEQRSSPCALGVVVARAGAIVEKRSWLIRPRELYFNPYNTEIHGISAEDVIDQPEFSELWDTFRPYFEKDMVIAHNATFDMSVLRATLSLYGMRWPAVRYLCTRLISRYTWPGLLSYSLQSVADSLGIEFDHHDPLEDAYACSEIVRAACEQKHAKSIQDLAVCLDIRLGCVSSDQYRAPEHRARKKRHPGSSHGNLRVRDLTASSSIFDPEHPLFGRTVVFTGTLRSMPRRDAMQRVIDVGGTCGTSVGKNTDYLVLGDLDFRKLRGGDKSAKLNAAEALIARGGELEVIPEEDFLKLLSG